MKLCKGCDTVRDEKQFSRRSASKDGLQARCKLCESSKKLQWQKDNPDKCRANNSRSYVNNGSKWNERKKIKYRIDPEPVRLSNEKYRTSNPKAVRVRNQRYRASMQSRFVEHVYDNTVFERDNWICQLCFEPVDPDLKGRDPMAKSLDHIIPLSLGGEHSYMNTQLAHFGCNSSKGNRIQPTYQTVGRLATK